MRIITGSDNGVVKVTWVENRQVVGVWGQQRARCSVDAMCWASKDEAAVAVGLQTGEVSVIDVSSVGDVRQLEIAGDKAASGKASAKSDKAAQLNNSAADAVATTADTKSSSVDAKNPLDNNKPKTPIKLGTLGTFHVPLPPAPKETTKKLQGAGGSRSIESAAVVSRMVGIDIVQDWKKCVVTTDYGHLFVYNRSSEHADWSGAEPTNGGKPLALFKKLPPLPRGVVAGPSVKGGPLRCAHVDTAHTQRVLAYAGREIDLTLHDLDTNKTTFHAKNLSNTALKLRPPIWVNSLAFHNTDQRLVTVSAFSDLRVYDPRAQRRPIFHTKHREAAFKCVTVSPDDRTYVLSDNRGHVTLWDVRKQRPLGGMAAARGAQLDMYFHQTLPYVVTVGLDRHARLYDSNTRRLQYSIYLKQHLTKSLLSGAVEQPRGGGRGRTAAIDMPITDAMAAKAEEAVRRARARTEIGDTDWDEADDNQLWATLPTAVEPEHSHDDDDDDADGESSTEHGTLPSDLPDESDSDTSSSSSSSDNEPTPPPRRNAKRKAAAAPKNTRATRRK